mgnify:CR=1 FL=1
MCFWYLQGFDGMMVTDWGTIKDLHDFHLIASTQEQAVAICMYVRGAAAPNSCVRDASLLAATSAFVSVSVT